MDFSSLTPLEGGWSGATFLATAGGARSVVRIYDPARSAASPRGDAAHEVDAALLRLVRGLVPVPEVLEVVAPDPEQDRPALLLTSYVEGVRGDVLWPDLDVPGRRRLGRAVGELVADLSGMPTTAAGPFVDAELRIGTWGDLDGLPDWLERHEPRLAHLDPDELDGLREVALDAQVLLDTVTRTCLVHSDLNLKNLLVTASGAVAALVDWEHAHAGHPFTDLGNVLRWERDPTYVEAVLEAHAVRRGVAPVDALALARAADLWALVDLAARRHDNPVAARADRLLRRIGRARDAGAPPAD